MASAPILRVGVIGLGKMGMLHGAIFSALEGVAVPALCDSEPIVARVGRRVLPRRRFYTDYLRMIDEETLDAVVVATPIHTHGEIVAEILRRGRLHVFVEKPLSGDAVVSEEVWALAEQAAVVNMVGYMKRFNPVFRRARDLLTAGMLGDLLFYRATSFSGDVLGHGEGWRFRKGSGGVLLELGAHLVDLLLWFFGEPTNAEMWVRSEYSEAEDYAHLTLVHGTDLVGHADVCWSIRGYRLPEVAIEVHGKTGSLSVTDDGLQVTTKRESGDVSVRRDAKASFNTSVPFLLGEPEFCAQALHFVDCVRRGQRPETDFTAALQVDRLLTNVRRNAVEVRG